MNKYECIHDMKNHKYLRYTNSLLFITFFYFISNIRDLKATPKFEFVLASFLIITIVFSQIFWNNPIKHSKNHRNDAIIAKISSLLFILYTLVYKFRFSYLVVLSASGVSFYFSNKYSNQEWCSNKHLCCHGLLHIFGFIATLYAFHQV
jgi:hypothetical protein